MDTSRRVMRSSALHIKLASAQHIHSQKQSPLFSTVPPEIRNLIFHYALLSDVNQDRLYDIANCYVRPGYTGARRTDTALLRTCKLVYKEAWFRPWTSYEHTLYFTAADRHPPYVTTTESIRERLVEFERAGVNAEIDHVRIFAQLCRLEDGEELQSFLNMDAFRPRCITISLRHTDWWHWEGDEPLRIAARFVRDCRFPDTVQCVRMELESLERKKSQIDSIASQMTNSWYFRRRDGTELEVQAEPKTEGWSGISVWNDQRWLRDESKPLELDYYVATLLWQPRQRPLPELATYNAPPDLRAINPGPGIQRRCGYLPWPFEHYERHAAAHRKESLDAGPEFINKRACPTCAKKKIHDEFYARHGYPSQTLE